MCYNEFTIKIKLFRYRRFKDEKCAYKILGRPTQVISENQVIVFLKQPIAVLVQRLVKINVCMSTLTILANKLLELELGAYH